jgi:hypothetical protein
VPCRSCPSRAVEETAASGFGSAEHVSAEGRGVEIRFAVSWILIDVQRLTVLVGFVDAEIVDAVGLGAEQGIVAEVDQSHRKTRTQVRAAGKFPARRQPVGNAEKTREREQIVVADDEVVFDVERRECFASRRISKDCIERKVAKFCCKSVAVAKYDKLGRISTSQHSHTMPFTSLLKSIPAQWRAYGIPSVPFASAQGTVPKWERRGFCG